MTEGLERIHEKIRSFQKKYYLDIFIRGLILTLSITLLYFLIAALLEHNLWLSQWIRLLIFVAFFGIVFFCVFLFLKEPIRWWIARKGLGEEKSAKIIGGYMPDVKDRLLNLIQLTSSANSSDLTQASINQKSRELEPLSFESVVNLSENKKYLKFLAIPVAIFLLIFLINQRIITQSTNRIVHFNEQFSPNAPFKFVVTKPLLAFYNEDFTLNLTLLGNALPESVYINGSQRLKMQQQKNGEFSYTFENLQNSFSFQFEAAGFFSGVYEVTVANRPELLKFKVDLDYPRYIQRKNESINNAGNLEIPEGTIVTWNLQTSNAEKAVILFNADNLSYPFESPDEQFFTLSKKFKNPDQYEILLANDKSKNKEKISYHVDVIKDQYPQIIVNNLKDSVLYKRIMLGGFISDDYGITELSLHFRVSNENQKEVSSSSIKIPINRNLNQQNFFYNWAVDSLTLKPGEQLAYYLQLGDNDGVNGRKFTKTATYNFLIPSENNLIADINKSSAQTEQKIEESTSKASKLQDQIEQAYQKLKGKQNLDWQDRKMLEDIIQQKESLTKMIDQFKEQNKLLQDKKETFTQQDERIKEKAEQIQKLMDQLLDDETKKLFEELQKLLKENTDVSQIQKLLDKINQNTGNLEKELDRMLALFKQVEFETKFDLTVEKIKQQVEEQKKLLEKTDALDKENKKQSSKTDEQKNDKNSSDKDSDKNNHENSSPQELAKEQEKLNEDFNQTKERIEELQKMSDEMNKDEQLPSKDQTDQIQEEQKESKESLENNKPSKAKQNQQKALKKMKDMQEQMEGMQSSMEMEIDAENLEALRQIIHGLIKLSFDQESLMKNFNELQQNDPRYVTLAQEQLKLKDDAKVLEDSLLAVAKKDPFMGSFVTREVGELNNHLDKVSDANKERRRPQASSEMQLSMTSINNLALMLDNHYDMMMQMMANAQPSMKKSKQKGQKPNLSELQQQLNQKIEQLKGSGKSGRQLSEQLAEMAAEQERIRRALQEMQDKMKNPGEMPGGDLPSKMEQTEMDLVNKQLTDQMIKRQKDIMTRLLETEKSMREQDQDDERKGETAKDYEKEIPKAFEDYLRLKEKELELLKTVPPKLYPYYKKEVGEYFKRIGN